MARQRESAPKRVRSPDVARGARGLIAAKDPHYRLAGQVLSAAGGLRAGLAAEGPLPSRRDLRALVDELLEVLFPESHRMGSGGDSLQGHVARTIAALEPRL